MKEKLKNILSAKKYKFGLIPFVSMLLCVGIVGGLVACSSRTAAPTQDNIVSLLQNAEAIYQLGNTDILTIAQYELQPLNDQLYYDEISNYQQAVSSVFSDNGIKQLEQSTNLGVPLILKQDGKIYRASAMSDSAATVYYGTIKSVKLLEEKDGHFVYEIVHIAEPKGSDSDTSGKAPELTDRVIVIKKDNSFLVEDFPYPLSTKDSLDGSVADDSNDYAEQNAALKEMYQRLLNEDNQTLLTLLNERITAYQNGTFVEVPNHHPNWPDSFPPPTVIPQPLTMQDIRIQLTPFKKISSDSYQEGNINVWVRIDDTHWLTLEPAWFGQADSDAITLGFGNSGFYEGEPPFEFSAQPLS